MHQHIIFLVDMQTFYASCEKAAHPGLKGKPVIVAGDQKERSGIVLAACPIAKEVYGVKTAEGLWEAKRKCPNAVIMKPRMQHYIDVSLQITEIFESFTDLVEPYSIDEQFLDVTGSQNLFGQPIEMARKIQLKIRQDVGVYARVGIGRNKVSAKMACDNFAKKNKSGIFALGRKNIEKYLWPLPINCLFGVGQRMEEHLIRMGIRTIGTLANFPAEELRKRWGINGIILWQTANGIDPSVVSPHSHNAQKAINTGMTLPFDYSKEREIKGVLLEMCEEVARRARHKHYRGSLISTGVRGADFDFYTGFWRQMKISFSTNYGLDIYRAACLLFDQYWDHQPIRRLSVTLGDLQPANEYQLDFLADLERKDRLNWAADVICQKYGNTALFRGVSLFETAQLANRAAKIGGHDK